MINTTQDGHLIKFYWDNGAYLGYAYMEVDGEYVFIISGQGAWADYALRAIADKLTELNEPIRKEIREYFKDKP